MRFTTQSQFLVGFGCGWVNVCPDSALRNSPLGVNVARDDVIHEGFECEIFRVGQQAE